MERIESMKTFNIDIQPLVRWYKTPRPNGCPLTRQTLNHCAVYPFQIENPSQVDAIDNSYMDNLQEELGMMYY